MVGAAKKLFCHVEHEYTLPIKNKFYPASKYLQIKGTEKLMGIFILPLVMTSHSQKQD